MMWTIEFTEYIPDDLANDTIYISIEHRTIIHLCACGCEMEVVTPLSPTDWRMTYDGESISLYPSIGNWSFPCRSHYWIKNSQIVWAERWSENEVHIGRYRNRQNKADYYADLDARNKSDQRDDQRPDVVGDESLISRFKKWFARIWQK